MELENDITMREWCLGDEIDALDSQEVWNPASIVRCNATERPADGTQLYKVHYWGWKCEYDEWLPASRIAPAQTFVQREIVWANSTFDRQFRTDVLWPSILFVRTGDTDKGRRTLEAEQLVFVEPLSLLPDSTSTVKHSMRIPSGCWVKQSCVTPFIAEEDHATAHKRRAMRSLDIAGQTRVVGRQMSQAVLISLRFALNSAFTQAKTLVNTVNKAKDTTGTATSTQVKAALATGSAANVIATAYGADRPANGGAFGRQPDAKHHTIKGITPTPMGITPTAAAGTDATGRPAAVGACEGTVSGVKRPREPAVIHELQLQPEFFHSAIRNRITPSYFNALPQPNPFSENASTQLAYLGETRAVPIGMPMQQGIRLSQPMQQMSAFMPQGRFFTRPSAPIAHLQMQPPLQMQSQMQPQWQMQSQMQPQLQAARPGMRAQYGYPWNNLPAIASFQLPVARRVVAHPFGRFLTIPSAPSAPAAAETLQAAADVAAHFLDTSTVLAKESAALDGRSSLQEAECSTMSAVHHPATAKSVRRKSQLPLRKPKHQVLDDTATVSTADESDADDLELLQSLIQERRMVEYGDAAPSPLPDSVWNNVNFTNLVGGGVFWSTANTFPC